MLGELTRTGTVLLGTHFAGPSAGRVLPDEKAYRPEPLGTEPPGDRRRAGCRRAVGFPRAPRSRQPAVAGKFTVVWSKSDVRMVSSSSHLPFGARVVDAFQ